MDITAFKVDTWVSYKNNGDWQGNVEVRRRVVEACCHPLRRPEGSGQVAWTPAFSEFEFASLMIDLSSLAAVGRNGLDSTEGWHTNFS
jgi:hypothetical protein